ncbi:VWA domain-containing protein [Methanospirillum sp.]|uniref:VWA domain-containing protein n=1 Tax=Methanospirillum sp. TaxID=45200 RepID=UPI0035A13EA0
MYQQTTVRIMLIIGLFILALSGDALAATDGTSSSESQVIGITGINAVNFPNVITYVTVDTPKGREGSLTADDFQIYENGELMEITYVQFPDSTSRTRLDLVILFDETGSMSEEIADMKAQVNKLTDAIEDANIDSRYMLISFNDYITVRQEWTSDPVLIRQAVDSLEAEGGDDAPEANLDAIEAALSSGFRPDAQHMILDITDSMTHYRGDGTDFSQYTIPETADHLLQNGTSYILVGSSSVSGLFNIHSDKKELVKALGGSGLFIDIHGDDFSAILNRIQSIITHTYTISYSTPRMYRDDQKVTLEVRVGYDSAKGLFTVQNDRIFDPSLSKITSVIPEIQDPQTTPPVSDDISTYGSSVVDITGINGVNFPYIMTYVTVNSNEGKSGALRQEDFQVYEDNELMNITSFSFSDRTTASKLDLAIVFDDTGSMSDEINDTKKKVMELTESISLAGIDCQYALISFKDTVTVRQEWTSEPSVIKQAVDGLHASEGFDAPEANLDAIEAALKMGFRSDAQHMIIDITDDLTHYRGDGTPFSKYTISETTENLLNNGTSFILVGPTAVSGSFNEQNDMRELVKALGGSGLFIDIHGDEFSTILDNIEGIITHTYTLGYFSPKQTADGSKRMVRVVVVSDEDSGQYIATAR